jgi:hypothetical protein
MSWLFRRSVRLFPGVRLNFSKSGITTTVGPRGAHVTLGGKRTRITAGIPGTGLYSTQLLPARSKVGRGVPDGSAVNGAHRGLGFAVLVSVVALVAFCSHRSPIIEPASRPLPIAPLLGPSSSAASPEMQREVSSAFVVAARSLNTRDAPDGRIIDSLTHGSSVDVYETRDGWSRISPTTESAKWVSAKLLCVRGSCGDSGRTNISAQRIAPTAGKSPASAASIHTPRKIASPDGSCSCAGARYCVGPRGGVYCFTSGGNKRYVSRR